MDSIREALAKAERAVSECVGSTPSLRLIDDADLMTTVAAVSRVQRLLDAVMITAVEEVSRRTEAPGGAEPLTHRHGCATVSELLQRLTLASATTTKRWEKIADAVAHTVSITGESLDGTLPALRSALLDGQVGVDGALAVAGPLLELGRHVSRAEVEQADAALAATARGDSGPAPSADLLRVHARAWAEALDRDGAEPRETRHIRRRAVRLGRPTDDGVPVHGMLLPEVAAQMQTIFDAVLNPRHQGVVFTERTPEDDAPLDDRTRPQRQHDALATALSVAASSGLMPTVGGAAPTLVVSVRSEDLSVDRGHAHIDGEPVSLESARHIACTGAVQRVVLGADGRILRLGTEERVFNRHQRRAIALRDGGCIIPGCGVRAGWCEIHHVTEHAHGGPTHTDNGVLLCWFHHRFLDRSGWRIRMNRGVPEVRAPGWYDATLRWRAVTTSRMRLMETVLRR